MSNKFKLEVHLEQYTPMLHFQGEQDGACLRATEVKPKLDRFVLEFLKHQLGSRDKIPKEWFVQKDSHDALNYKMSFEPVGVQEQIMELHPLYFGDQGDNKGKIKNVYYPRGMKMRILCLVEKECAVTMPNGNTVNRFLEILEEMIPAFFALHCFGMRSNKGFGCFGVKGKTMSVSRLSAFAPEKCTAIFELKHNKEIYTHLQRLDDIYVISGMMKGGFNRPYFKGEIQKLSSNQNIGSEKAFLKQQIFNPGETIRYQDVVCRGNDHTPRHKYPKYEFIRALLGLTTQYPFGVGENRMTFSFESVNKKIGKFPSPLHFIPGKDRLLITVYEIPAVMLGAEFTIRGKSIKTPAVFDLPGFVSDFRDIWNSEYLPDDWDDLVADGKYKMRDKRSFYYDNTIDDMLWTDEWRRK